MQRRTKSFQYVGRGHGGRKRDGTRSNKRATFDEVPKKNYNFEHLYNDSGILDEEEKEAFWNALRRELPSSFRFTGSKGCA